MFTSSTPFKIHDENENIQTKTSIKGNNKLGGTSNFGGLSKNTTLLNNNNNHTVLKKNVLLPNSEIKSNRKALANLSTSQINIRSTQIINNNTPAIHLNKIYTNKILKFNSDVTINNNSEITILKERSQKINTNSSSLPIIKEQPPIIVINNKTTAENNKLETSFNQEDMLCSHITDDEDPYEIVLKQSKNSSLLRESLYQDIDFDSIREEINKNDDTNESSNEYIWNDDDLESFKDAIDTQYSYDILQQQTLDSNQENVDMKLMDLSDL